MTPTETNVDADALCFMVKTWARHKTTETRLNNGWRLAVGGWRLAADGPWGLSLRAVLNNKLGVRKDGPAPAQRSFGLCPSPSPSASVSPVGVWDAPALEDPVGSRTLPGRMPIGRSGDALLPLRPLPSFPVVRTVDVLGTAMPGSDGGRRCGGGGGGGAECACRGLGRGLFQKALRTQRQEQVDHANQIQRYIKYRRPVFSRWRECGRGWLHKGGGPRAWALCNHRHSCTVLHSSVLLPNPCPFGPCQIGTLFLLLWSAIHRVSHVAGHCPCICISSFSGSAECLMSCLRRGRRRFIGQWCAQPCTTLSAFLRGQISSPGTTASGTCTGLLKAFWGH